MEKTPLHSALTSESPFDANITDILIIAGADVNIKDKYGETPLHFAAKHSDTEVTTILLNAGANVNDQTNVKENTWIGWTSLHFAACCNENPEIITILIQAGGDINAQTKEGNTPLHIAAKSNINHHITIALIDAGANINAINKYHEDRHGIFYKATPLHLAVGGYNNELVAILIKLGADINIRDKDGLTPLHWAGSRGNSMVFSILVKAGADVNALNNAGKKTILGEHELSLNILFCSL